MRRREPDGPERPSYPAMKRTGATTVLVAAAALLASGCGGATHKTAEPTSASGPMGGSFSETASPAGSGSSKDGGGSDESFAADASGAGASSSATTAAGSASAPNQPALGLRAGKVDDNDRFADYLAYRTTFAKTGAE